MRNCSIGSFENSEGVYSVVCDGDCDGYDECCRCDGCTS